MTARSVAMTRSIDSGCTLDGPARAAVVAVETNVMSGGQSLRPPISAAIPRIVPEPMGPRMTTLPPDRFAEALNGFVNSTSWLTARYVVEAVLVQPEQEHAAVRSFLTEPLEGDAALTLEAGGRSEEAQPFWLLRHKARGGQRGHHGIAGPATLLRVLGVIAAEDQDTHDVCGRSGPVELDDDLGEALAPRALRGGILIRRGVLRPLHILVDGGEGILPEPPGHVLQRARRIAGDFGGRRAGSHELPLPDDDTGEGHEHGRHEGDRKAGSGAVLLLSSGHAFVPFRGRRSARATRRATSTTTPTYRALSLSMSTRRRILPEADFGIWSMNSIWRMRLWGATRSATQLMMASAFVARDASSAFSTT